MGDAACHLDSVCLSCGRFVEGDVDRCPHCGGARDGTPGRLAAVIRSARPEDAEVVGALTEHAYRVDGHLDGPGAGWYAEHLRDAAGRIAGADVVVAEVGGVVLASVTAAAFGTPYAETARPDELEVRMLAVDPTVRRRGLAEALMREVERRAVAAGLGRVVLSTEPAMHAAHRLYGRLGYRRQPDRDWRVDGYDLISYGRDLTP